MINIGKVIQAMVEYDQKDTKRIEHFLKVYGYAKTIGELENIPQEQQEILEVAAVVHDIGIKVSEEKYHSSAGTYQELEGPVIAKKMLKDLGYDERVIDRVCYLVGHHHTYNKIDRADYQILVEADFLVNISEDNMTEKQIDQIRQKIFKTKTGFALLKNLYR